MVAVDNHFLLLFAPTKKGGNLPFDNERITPDLSFTEHASVSVKCNNEGDYVFLEVFPIFLSY